jgi:hypothetical protein
LPGQAPVDIPANHEELAALRLGRDGLLKQAGGTFAHRDAGEPISNIESCWTIFSAAERQAQPKV